MVAAGLALGLLPPVAVADSTVGEVAGALRADPVYVADSEGRLLTIPGQGRVRIRIAQRDIGRIQIALVSPQSARRAGGLGQLANAVDQAMPGRRGSLILTTGSAFHVVTSHAAVAPTAAALRTAVEANRGGGLAAQLLAAVDRIADVDPGPAADPLGPSTTPPSPTSARPGDAIDDVGESLQLGVLIVAASIALPFLLGAIVSLVAYRRRREAGRDREQLERGDARDELIVFGEEIRSLDLDVEMPNASPRGRDEFERALKLYDRANTLLARKGTGEVELYEARRSVEEGRSRLAAARDALAAASGV